MIYTYDNNIRKISILSSLLLYFSIFKEAAIMKSLVELSQTKAEEFVLNSLCENDDNHSCEWKRLLPVLSHAFQHHLDTVLELCLDIMPKVRTISY